MKETFAEKSVHLIGIGGIGISAIARMLLLEGKKVSGSDAHESPVTEELSRLGAHIEIGHRESNVPQDCKLVLYTVAVSANNPEILEGKRRNLPLLSYPEALGKISKEKFTIAISGTHGKTTTTGMVAKILKEAGEEPTVIIGSILKDEHSNFLAGRGEIFVVEACEYRRSFLNLSPKIAIITNIDNDHLDYYGSLEEIQKAFREFAEKLGDTGVLICDKNDPRLSPVIKGLAAKIIDYRAFLQKVPELQFSGEHNRLDAAAACAAAAALEIPEHTIREGLKKFSGTARRFEYKGKMESGALVYDDYAHHPTEIRATLLGTREKFPGKKIIAAFEPHLYSRTKLLLPEFTGALSLADRILLAPIYAAREPLDPSITSEMLAEALREKQKNAESFPSLEAIADALGGSDGDSVILTMGAGSITRLSSLLPLRKEVSREKEEEGTI